MLMMSQPKNEFEYKKLASEILKDEDTDVIYHNF